MCIRGSNFFVLFVVSYTVFCGSCAPFLRESEEATGVFGCDFSDLFESQVSFIGDLLCDERDIL